MEEDELFDVQGKLGDSPWFLLDTCKCKMHVTVTSVFQKLLVSQLEKFQEVPHCVPGVNYMSFPIKEWRLSKQNFIFNENSWFCFNKSYL